MSGGSVVSSVTASADIDGQWHTSGAVHLNAGTYSATMTEYLPSDTNFASALSLPSQPLTLHVWNEIEYVSSGTVSSGGPVTSGLMLEVLSGGTADVTSVTSGALLQVDGGGQASGTVVSQAVLRQSTGRTSTASYRAVMLMSGPRVARTITTVYLKARCWFPRQAWLPTLPSAQAEPSTSFPAPSSAARSILSARAVN